MKKKNKVARYQISLNEPQKNMLDEMMEEDAQSEVSTFFGFVLVNEYKRRQVEKNRRPPGRPRKEGGEESDDEEGSVFEEKPDFSDDLPKNIIHYGRMIGKKEMEYLERLQEHFRPQ